MADEINNPLSFLCGNLDYVASQIPRAMGLLRAPAGEEAEARALLADLAGAVADAQQGGQRVAHIVRGLKTFARDDEGAGRRWPSTARSTPPSRWPSTRSSTGPTWCARSSRCLGAGQRGPPLAGLPQPPHQRRPGHPRGRPFRPARRLEGAELEAGLLAVSEVVRE